MEFVVKGRMGGKVCEESIKRMIPSPQRDIDFHVFLEVFGKEGDSNSPTYIAGQKQSKKRQNQAFYTFLG